MRGSTEAERNRPQSIIICQDEMKTLLKMNDKTIGKVGPQILKPGVREKENPGKIGGHITSFFAPNLHPHTSEFPGRERGRWYRGEGGRASITISGSKARGDGRLTRRTPLCQTLPSINIPLTRGGRGDKIYDNDSTPFIFIIISTNWKLQSPESWS